MQVDLVPRIAGRALQVVSGDTNGAEQVQSISRKGFYSKELGWPKQVFRTAANDEVPELQAAGSFLRTPDQLHEGLLGMEGSRRLSVLEDFMELQQVQAASGQSGQALALEPMHAGSKQSLQRLAEELEQRAGQLAAWAPSVLKFQLTTRSPFMLLEADHRASQGSSPELSNDALLRWVHIFQRHRIMMLVCVGPESGSLEMRPFSEDAGTHRLQMRPGSLVLLRADCLSHRFSSRGKCFIMASFLMGPNPQENAPLAAQLMDELSSDLMRLKEQSKNEGDFEAKTSRQLQRLANQTLHKGHQVAIRGCAGREPLASCHADAFCAANLAGCDGAQLIPHLRWDHDAYYAPEPHREEGGSWKTHTQHCCFIDGLELFDNKLFKISPMEAAGMDPNQRQALEIFLETTLSAGIDEKQMMRQNIGVFVGGTGGYGEFNQIPKESVSGALASTSGSAAITANRISFVFGIHGPNFFMDLEGSASLVAFNLAVDAVNRDKQQCVGAVALGLDCQIAPQALLSLGWAGLVSKKGRCLSFDSFADGYIRGDGFTGLYVNPLTHEVDGRTVICEDPPIIALASGTFSNNSGRSASLTAPSGAMMQELVANCVRSADISPLDVDLVECHANGNVLADAVEATALCRAYRASCSEEGEDEVLSLTVGKTNFGNQRPAAGTAQLLRLIVGQAMGCVAPMHHLRKLNPHIAQTDDAPAIFATEHVQGRMATSFGAVTASGMGGSNAHAILWGRSVSRSMKVERQVQPEEVLSFWPGGGGDLDPECEPQRGCSIVGSWSLVDTIEPMKSDGMDKFSYVLTLGEHSCEWFHILLDGDQDRVLHPGIKRGEVDARVRGPSSHSEACALGWVVDGRPRRSPGERGEPADSSVQQLPNPDSAQPGDQFRVKLEIKGRYRAVTWERLEQSNVQRNGLSKTMGRYYVAGSWNDWQPEEMKLEDEYLGRYSLKAALPKGNQRFQILRNRDWRQLVYPEMCYADCEDDVPVKGPDADGHDSYWSIEVFPSSNLVRIDLELWPEEESSALSEVRGSLSSRAVQQMKVVWRSVGKQDLSPEEAFERSRPSFFLAGSWDSWLSRTKMRFDGLRQCYVARVPRALQGGELFQILSNGDWNSVLHPSHHEASSENSAAIRGGGVRGFPAWLIQEVAQSENDEETRRRGRGDRYEVLLSIKGQPWKVQWQQCSAEQLEESSDEELDRTLYGPPGSDGL